MPVIVSAGGLLREARQRAALTQAQLAQKAGVTQSVISAYESGRRQPSLALLLDLLRASGHVVDASLIAADPHTPAPLSGPLGRRVRRHQRAIKAVAASHGVRNVRVCGSVARGTDTTTSDVDLLVEFPEDTGLFAIGRLRHDLETLLRARVDLVPAEGLKPGMRAEVEGEAVRL